MTDPEQPPILERHKPIDYQTTEKSDNFLLKALIASAPGINTLRNHRRQWRRSDVFAGIAVASYLIPQCMAYSALVGVSPVVGLYTALASLIVYAAMGASRILSVGPESTVALMAGAAIAPLAGGDPAKAVVLGAALSIIVGLWCLVARVLGLGVVAELLSQPLLVGYLAGGAILMTVGQLGKLTGTSVEGEGILEQLESFVAVAPDTHWLTLGVGAGTLALLLFVHWLRPLWPATLIAVVGATIASVAWDFESRGVRIVGDVPSGLQWPSIPVIPWSDTQTLLLAGVGVAIVAYGDNTLVARGFPAPLDPDEDRSINHVNPQQELTALAGTSFASGLMGGFPVSSSASRTALAQTAGARTQLYSLVAAAVVVLVLFAAAPLIYHLPMAALGAVVLYAASHLISIKELKRLAKFRRRELALALAAAAGTVMFGILAGVGVAIALSFMEMSQRLARPNDGVLGRVPGLAGMHNVLQHKGARTLPGLIVYRFDAPLFFGNVSELRRRVTRVVDQEIAAYPEALPRWFILNVEANVEIDITAADGLSEMYADLAGRGVRLGFARVKQDLLAPLQRAGLDELIGEDMLFPTLPTAEEAFLAWVAEQKAAGELIPGEDPVPDEDDGIEVPVETFEHHADADADPDETSPNSTAPARPDVKA